MSSISTQASRILLPSDPLSLACLFPTWLVVTEEIGRAERGQWGLSLSLYLMGIITIIDPANPPLPVSVITYLFSDPETRPNLHSSRVLLVLLAPLPASPDRWSPLQPSEKQNKKLNTVRPSPLDELLRS
ncbi:uncharacterized protein BO97DRAFT_214071 [Aspergillus homomorphus CBS 101889]|uniref:Uncharacterized protein n=1 Tax=Aspergillus homomorphus (strain CBS 101889) TaxID=1450537 RepID=A0A395I8C5_ASPHC|nr:hypothetical protein BO97DRAFT_214071 [Aspergillus homomorphus CBS 101889]RAL15503.1 hypothetical protein BO97DRAFT_214071 [Aspergillus homomorphus CBS 101889]